MQGLLRHLGSCAPLVVAFAALLAVPARSSTARDGGPTVDAARAVTGPPLEIAVTWDDPTRALPFPSTWVARELAEQLRPLGILVRFQSAAEFTVTPAETFRVILLTHHPLERTRRSNAIGLAHREPRARAVWLLLSSTQRALGLSADPAFVPPLREQRMLARALARVAAHELVHALAPGHPHAADGLMRARLDRRALTGTRVDFDPATARVLLTALRGDAVPGARIVAAETLATPFAQPSFTPLGTAY